MKNLCGCHLGQKMPNTKFQEILKKSFINGSDAMISRCEYCGRHLFPRMDTISTIGFFCGSQIPLFMVLSVSCVDYIIPIGKFLFLFVFLFIGICTHLLYSVIQTLVLICIRWYPSPEAIQDIYYCDAIRRKYSKAYHISLSVGFFLVAVFFF